MSSRELKFIVDGELQRRYPYPYPLTPTPDPNPNPTPYTLTR